MDTASDGEIVQLLPSPSPVLFARFVGDHQAVIDWPIVCLALVRHPVGQSIEAVVVEQGEFKLATQIGSLLGYHDGRGRHEDVDWNERANAWRQAHPKKIEVQVEADATT